MIATLSGVVSEKLLNQVILDVGGIGYGVQITVQDFSQLHAGNEAKLYIYEHIREQSHDLFGFTATSAKKLFEQLLTVKSVGPKVAMAVLDVGNEATVRSAIANGEVKLLQSAKGVGKRAAEQIVVELRDKVGLGASDAAEDIVTRPGANMQDEAVEALVSLGYSPQDAAGALKGIDESLPTEDRIKQALRGK